MAMTDVDADALTDLKQSDSAMFPSVTMSECHTGSETSHTSNDHDPETFEKSSMLFDRSPSKFDSTNETMDEEMDLIKVFYSKEPKSTELRISCQICGDKASGFHYGVHACEGCKGFFRRTVRMRLKYKECTIGCKVNIKTRNKCQYCRFQKCIKSGMSHDAIRFGRMSRVEKKKIISKMAREEPELLNRKKFEEEDKLKSLTETLASAFQDHISLTRTKMVALWQKRDLPGAVAPCLTSLEDVKKLYPILKGSTEETPSPQHAASPSTGRQQFYDRNQNRIADQRSDEDLAYGFLDDMSFSSSSSSNSDSDELLHAVKKSTIPSPSYVHEGKTPQLPSQYQDTISFMGAETESYAFMKNHPATDSQLRSGDFSMVDVSQKTSDSCYSSSSEEYYFPFSNPAPQSMHNSPSSSHGSMSSLSFPLGNGQGVVNDVSNLEKMFHYIPGLRLVFSKVGITVVDVISHSKINNCSTTDSLLHLLRDARVKIKLEGELGMDKAVSGSSGATPVKNRPMAPNQNPVKQIIDMKIVKFLYQRMQKRLVKGVCELTEFSKRIPGFTSLALSDQVILLKYGSYEALFVLLGAMIFQKGMLLPDGNLYVTFDFVSSLGDSGQIMRPKFEFAEKIASLNLQDKDFALFVAAIILFGDRPGLCNKEKVEEIQSDILRALELQLKASHPNDSQLFAKLLLKMTDLRQLVADHVAMTERVANMHSMKKLFHPLISELLNDRE